MSQILCNHVKQCEQSENIGKGAGDETAPFTVIIAVAMPYVKVSASSVRHPVSKIDSQLSVDYTPILAPARPFLGNVHHGQVQHLQQAVVRGKNRLGFGHLPELAIKALNGVGGIDQPPDFLGELEIGA